MGSPRNPNSILLRTEAGRARRDEEAANQAATQAKAQQEYRNNFSTNYSRLTASDIEEEEKMGMKHGGKVAKKTVKKYAGGGLAGLADTANSLMNEVDGMANTINYGAQNSIGSTGTVGFNAITNMKKGGKVSSASKRADGIAIRGKTRA